MVFLYTRIVKSYSLTITACIPDARLQYNTETCYTNRTETAAVKQTGSFNTVTWIEQTSHLKSQHHKFVFLKVSACK